MTKINDNLKTLHKKYKSTSVDFYTTKYNKLS